MSQTVTSITVSPSSVTLAAGTQQFTAVVTDQFGNAVTQPALAWSVVGAPGTSSPGSINSSGLYTPPYASGAATVGAISGQLTATASVTFSGQAQWNSASAASWNTPGDWKDAVSGSSIAPPGLRGVAGDTVLFAAESGTTVSLDGTSPSVAEITLSSSNPGYTISQGTGGVLQLANGGNSASITVSSGSQTISAPLALGSNLAVLPAAGSRLTVTGGISGAGQSLNVNGGGTVVLSGANSYSGGTIVSAGKLIMSNSSAIAEGTSLTIGAGAAGLFNASPITPPDNTIAGASETSTPIVVRGAVVNAPVTAPAFSTLSSVTSATSVSPWETLADLATSLTTTACAAVQRVSVVAVPFSTQFRTDTVASPALVFVAKAGPSVVPSAAMSSATVDAVFNPDRSGFDQTVSSAAARQSARPWAWLAAIESSWRSLGPEQDD